MNSAVYIRRLLRSWFGRWCEPGFKYVYVNQDGSVRELSSEEKAYLSTTFRGDDLGAPYIKKNVESINNWGSQSGFIKRRRVPETVTILQVHPRYDDLVKELNQDIILGMARASQDIIVTNPDGSIHCSRNPEVSEQERDELQRDYWLEQQRRREDLAKVPV